jgi:hypothetical protein
MTDYGVEINDALALAFPLTTETAPVVIQGEVVGSEDTEK